MGRSGARPFERRWTTRACSPLARWWSRWPATPGGWFHVDRSPTSTPSERPRAPGSFAPLGDRGRYRLRRVLDQRCEHVLAIGFRRAFLGLVDQHHAVGRLQSITELE